MFVHAKVIYLPCGESTSASSTWKNVVATQTFACLEKVCFRGCESESESSPGVEDLKEKWVIGRLVR
jgi:hypothetical protein